MTTPSCNSCTQGPKGEGGHDALTFQVEGPVPGHHIFRCTVCDERWIRHYGSPTERFMWTRYSDVLERRLPRADPPPRTKVTG
jgi:hypothetical protein